MFELETERLYLVATPLDVIETRLNQTHFDVELRLAGQLQRVHFPPEWPGDVLGFFPKLVEQLRSQTGDKSWGATLVDKVTRLAIGQIGTKGPKDGTGTVDIGYGMNPTFEGRGYMTEAVQAYTGWLLTQPEMQRVTADCLEINSRSLRVLEKAGFSRIGEREEAGKGRNLIFWERRR